MSIRIEYEPSSLLTLVDSDPVVRRIMDHDVVESLVRLAPDGAHVVPELAERFEVDEECKTFTFHIADDARWHDGVPVTAFDVEFVLARISDPLKNTASVIFSNISEISVLNDRSVVVTLDRPTPDFLFELSAVPILPQHVFGGTPLALNAAAREPVGSGPFRFSRWEPSRLIELERNPDWRGVPPSVDRLVYRVVPDDRIAIDMFRQGNLDIVAGLPPDEKYQIEGALSLAQPQPYVEAWVYNTKNSLFSDVAARRAVGHLIDRDTIRCAILKCGADEVTDPWLKGDSGPLVSPLLGYNRQRAVQILAEAGWADTDGDGILDKKGMAFSFSLLVSDLHRNVERTAVLAQGDMAAVGIDLKIVKVSRGAFFSRLRGGRFDVAEMSVRARPVFDAWSLLHSGAMEGMDNFGSFHDEELDQTLDLLQEDIDIESRRELMNAVNRRLRDLQPLTFTFRPYLSMLVSARIGCLVFRDGWLEERVLTASGEGS